MAVHNAAARRLQDRSARRRQRRDPINDIRRTQELTREGVIASGELLRPEILGRIGDTLGGLNSIGGLRSGGTEVALRDISREFTDRFGQIATRATLGAIGPGLGVADIRFRQREARKRRKGAFASAVGGVLGAGIGFATSRGGGGGGVDELSRV